MLSLASILAYYGYDAAALVAARSPRLFFTDPAGYDRVVRLWAEFAKSGRFSTDGAVSPSSLFVAPKRLAKNPSWYNAGAETK